MITFILRITHILIESFYEVDLEKWNKLLNKTMKKITRNLVPIRPDRNFPRRGPSKKKKFPSNKSHSV